MKAWGFVQSLYPPLRRSRSGRAWGAADPASWASAPAPAPVLVFGTGCTVVAPLPLGVVAVRPCLAGRA